MESKVTGGATGNKIFDSDGCIETNALQNNSGDCKIRKKKLNCDTAFILLKRALTFGVLAYDMFTLSIGDIF